MESVVDAIIGAAWSVAWVLVWPTIILLLLRRFMPAVGEQLWRGYCQLLAWLVRAPIELIRLLIREAVGRRNR